ncbi:hypothetical protein H8356DRAFT_430652 [Neocallimastix lanati (nom. inval.)]|uniref:Uncharacterized protein n=1 Tax=Neocallimastix californiae TaxID=1754190 RepID=A0A1Y2EN43_9FUNG|nr:hypothetical protein H8356DRAFT_430652 [Neocallimastix sp. JGI-2020a]ORY72265.1 hypothetical protein LY90DRAFT_198776 [Neocallimastix californiae]|eukprot:ORY72265.1 hypothetical protein LY90DRAFT_198776 [Neocallimastix californiae]
MNVNKNEHNHKNENENENKLENNRIKKNESNNKNENKVKEKKVEKEEEEWLNKELVDEPLTFKAEKRIVPFNHNRSKSLSFLQNSSKSNQYSKYHISNNNSMIQNSIKEEGNEISNNNKEFNDYPNEKSLVPFHNTRKNLDRRPLPSLTYSPLKNNEKEKIYSNENYALKEYNDDNAIDGKEYSKELVIKRIKGGLNHHENRKRIEVVPFNSIKYLVKRSISTPKHQSIWDIIIKKINLEKLIKNINNLFYRDFQNSPKQKKIKNRKRIQSVKGKNNKKSFPYQPRRHTYQNSKIYFTHLPNQKNVIETKFHSRNLYGKREELKKINPPEKQLTTFKPYYSQLKINQYNQLINTIKQKTIILNMILFLLKVYLLYQVLYPHKLFFVVALLLIIYNSNILRFNIFRFLAYSILDISFIYFVKIFYILYHGK